MLLLNNRLFKAFITEDDFIWVSIFCILEELIFRWFIFSSINKSLIIKVIVSSVLFGLMHFIPSIGAISLNELCLQSIQYVL